MFVLELLQLLPQLNHRHLSFLLGNFFIRLNEFLLEVAHLILKLIVRLLQCLDLLLPSAPHLLKLVLATLRLGDGLTLRLLEQVTHLANLLVTGIHLMLVLVLLPD